MEGKSLLFLLDPKLLNMTTLSYYKLYNIFQLYQGTPIFDIMMSCFIYHYSLEARELGFTLIIDGRNLSWNDIKLILRTSQEALPGQVHVAYILQPSQFMQKQQLSLSLSKEKDKLEFAVS